jgi:hypothetical protein
MFDSFATNSRFDFVGQWYDSITGKDKWIETEASTTNCSWQDDDETGWGGSYFVTYVYQANGEYYQGHFHTSHAFDRDTKLFVRYKPSNPKRKYLSGYSGGRTPLVLAAVAVGFGLFWMILHMMSIGRF